MQKVRLESTSFMIKSEYIFNINICEGNTKSIMGFIEVCQCIVP